MGEGKTLPYTQLCRGGRNVEVWSVLSPTVRFYTLTKSHILSQIDQTGAQFCRSECPTIPNLSVYFAMPVLVLQIHAGCGLNIGACISRYNFRHSLLLLLLASWSVDCKFVVYYTTSAKLRPTLHTANGKLHIFGINEI